MLIIEFLVLARTLVMVTQVAIARHQSPWFIFKETGIVRKLSSARTYMAHNIGPQLCLCEAHECTYGGCQIDPRIERARHPRPSRPASPPRRVSLSSISLSPGLWSGSRLPGYRGDAARPFQGLGNARPLSPDEKLALIAPLAVPLATYLDRSKYRSTSHRQGAI